MNKNMLKKAFASMAVAAVAVSIATSSVSAAAENETL